MICFRSPLGFFYKPVLDIRLGGNGKVIIMIERIINALMNKDSEALADCFTENCLYYDYCPVLNGFPNIYIYGNACMALLLRHLFVSGDLEVREPLIEDADNATFFGAYYGPYIYARLHIEEYDSEGRVNKVIVTPA